MATKNLVPRDDNEGKIGIPSRKWSEANFSSGSFETLSVDKFSNLKTSSGQALIKGGDNISFAEDSVTGQLTISSTAAGGGASPTSIHGLTDVNDTASNPLTGSGGYILSWTANEIATDNQYSILKVTQDIEIDTAGIASIQASAGPRLFSTTLAPIVTALTVNDKFLISRPNDANNLNGAWSNKTITKTNLISELNDSVATKFVDLTDVNGTFAAGNKVKAQVDISNNLTFVPDTNVYCALGDTTVISGGANTSKIIIARNYDSLNLAADPNFSEIDDNSSNWNTAYGWGNHVTAGYATATSLSGYALTTALDSYIKADGTTNFALTSDIQLNSADSNHAFTITNVPTPVSNTNTASHIVPKSYVDAISSGIQPFGAVKVATTANLNATLATNTLTSNSNGPFVVDGVHDLSASTNIRVLVKDQTAKIENGIYTITNAGDSSNPWVLTRTTDFDDTMDTASGVFVFVEIGTTNSSKGFVCISPDGSDTVGTHPIIWSAFSSAGSYSNGAGISISGSNINLDLNQGLTDFGTDEVVKKDDTLAIKDASDSDNTKSIKIEKLLGDVVDASTIEVDTDNTTEISKLQIKDEGVTLGKIEKVNRNKLLGFLSTDTAETTGAVSQVKVGIKGDTTTKWESADDTVIPTQLSVKTYVDSAYQDTQTYFTGDDPDFTAEEFTLTSSETDYTVNLTKDYQEYIGKSIKITLTGEWKYPNKIIVVLPPLVQDNDKNELIWYVFNQLGQWFEINVDSTGITNKDTYTQSTATRPYISFKPHSSCKLTQLSSWIDMGKDNYSSHSESDTKYLNKIAYIRAHKLFDMSGAGKFYGTNAMGTSEELTTRFGNDDEPIIGTSNDVWKVSLVKGAYVTNDNTYRGYPYCFELYQIN